MVRLKNISIILVLIILPIYLTGCNNNTSTFNGSKTGNNSQFLVDLEVLKKDSMDSDVKLEEPVIWYVDLTHDGINEKIVMDLTYVINYPETGEEKTVIVYSGSSGELLWTGHADTVHVGWNGIYIYNDGKNEYLVIWQPTIYQDIANFNIRIFSLDEDGKEKDLLKKNMEFDIYNPKESDFDEVSEFVDMVNGYLEKSYVLVDTNNATPVYSTIGNQIVNLYDVSPILKEMKGMKENN